MRTDKQIKAEIQKLQKFAKSLKVNVSVFGNDHEETINTQIAVLEGRLDGDEINDIEDDNLRASANDALDWLDESIDDVPSTGWEDSPHLFKS